MDHLIGPARLGAWVFASIAVIAGASRGAVVLPASPEAGWQSVADEVHTLAILVRARALIADRKDGGALRGHEAGSLAPGVLLGEGGAPRPRTDRPLPVRLSGGPLFDGRGHVVGLSTPPAGAEGTAAPASLLRSVLRKLVAAAGP